MKKIILHIVNSNEFSGLESVACDIIQNTNDSYDAIYVTRNGNIVNVLKDKKIQYEIIQKMSVSEIKRVVEKYSASLIHAHDYTASCICSLAHLKIPIISHLHNNNVWIRKMNFYSLLYLFCSLRIKKILTVSNSIEEEYIFSNQIKNKIENIGNPVDCNKIVKLAGTPVVKEFDIVCVARLTEAKDPFRFLEIIQELKTTFPNILVAWIGDGELKNEFERKIQELSLDKTICLLGYKKNPYVELEKGKIFLLTSKWEGFGLAAFEALSLGIPCVVSNVGGLSNIVDSSCGYLCSTNDEFIEGLTKLLSDKKLYQTYHKNALHRAEKMDNHEEYFKKIKNIYDTVV